MNLSITTAAAGVTEQQDLWGIVIFFFALFVIATFGWRMHVLLLHKLYGLRDEHTKIL